MRASTFHAVSPCRTAMMRVASITMHFMEGSASGKPKMRFQLSPRRNPALSELDHLQARQCRRRRELLVVEGLVAALAGHAGGHEAPEIVEARVRQVRGHDVLQCVQHVVEAAGKLL